MIKSESIKEIASALSKAQGHMENAVKDSSNPFFKSKYADLAAVRQACIKPLTDNGISVVQTVCTKKDGDKEEHYVETTLMHSSGEFISSGEIRLVLAKADMQSLGSAITYARRYQLQSIVGLSAEDDDGNAAVGHKNVETPAVTQPNTMQHLIDTAKKNMWLEEDLRQYISSLGYVLQAKGFPILTQTDYQDVLKHFSVKKEAK